GRHVRDLMAAPFELLLGRRTYDIFAGYWPHVPAGSGSRPLADRLNSAPKHVATHRPDGLSWQGSRALSGDLAEAVRALKRQGGADLLTFGSGDMVRQLLAADLVDDLSLLVYPVMLGPGKRVFGDDAQARAFTLERVDATPGGVLVSRYLRGGEVRTGSFEDGE
ncbi:dihydrofolate reductase, partial [Knoellia aerolata DSM 18566]